MTATIPTSRTVQAVVALKMETRRLPSASTGPKNGSGEMQNIKEGPQPASLFEIPAGYTKMDMGGMMQKPK